MATRTYSKHQLMGYNNVVLDRFNTVWQSSPRNADGTLRLRDNPLTRERTTKIRFTYNAKEITPYMTNTFPYGGDANGIPSLGLSTSSLQAQSYAMLRGRLYKGSAALGVTLGSWKQSREMIVSRYKQMTFTAEQFEARARRVIDWGKANGKRKRAVRIKLNKLGGQYLEAVFGWQPLLSDIHAACRTVIDTRPAVDRVTVRAQTWVDTVRNPPVAGLSPPIVSRGRVVGYMRVSRSATVEVSNPNSWLRERAGLNNPAAVAWDLVPWSFVVNMFVNTGQLVNSITDFVGLNFPSSSITTKYDLNYRTQISGRISPTVYGSGTADFHYDFKLRQLGGLARPPVVFKVPDLNWELAAIAASLFAQKFSAANTLLLTFKKPS